jgi:NAD(P)-dependent dehydrogenase (short-subunit alcohol dehydrogenase family)
MTEADFSGRVALVTGASRGIGRAAAEALGDAGAAVALVARNARELVDVAESLTRRAVRNRTFLCDVTDPARVAALPAEVEAGIGPVDVLVNNAGAAASAPFLKTDPATWNSLLALNLTAVYAMTRAFLPGMLARGFGRIVNVASTAGLVGYAYTTAYCASKHGVVGLTRALALEVADKGITVNAVCPSFVDTEMTERSIATIVAKTGRSAEEAKASLTSLNPQGRLIEPAEVAAAILYLASAAARGINGQALSICGGAVMS